MVDSADAGTLLHQWLHRLELVGLCINSRTMPGNHILMDACSTHDVWVLNEHLIQQPALQHLQACSQQGKPATAYGNRGGPMPCSHSPFVWQASSAHALAG